jgi:hypothetical protein
MTASYDVGFRSHVQSVDRGVSIVVDTSMPMLHDGLLSFRLKRNLPPEQVGRLVALLRDQVDTIEYRPVSRPVFQKA